MHVDVLQALCVVSFKTRGSIPRGISRHDTKCLSASPAVYRRFVMAMVLHVPAVHTLTTGTFDGEVSQSSGVGAGINGESSTLQRCWSECVDGSFMNWLRERVSLSGVVVPNQPLSQSHPKVLETLAGSGVSCWSEVLHQDEGIDNAAVEEEPEQVPIEFP